MVRPERMRANLGLTGSQLVSERVAAVLSPLLGRSRARQLLTEASAAAERDGIPLHTVLGAIPEVATRFDDQELAALLDPVTYTGVAGALVDRAMRPVLPPRPSAVNPGS